MDFFNGIPKKVRGLDTVFTPNVQMSQGGSGPIAVNHHLGDIHLTWKLFLLLFSRVGRYTDYELFNPKSP